LKAGAVKKEDGNGVKMGQPEGVENCFRGRKSSGELGQEKEKRGENKGRGKGFKGRIREN